MSGQGIFVKMDAYAGMTMGVPSGDPANRGQQPLNTVFRWFELQRMIERVYSIMRLYYTQHHGTLADAERCGSTFPKTAIFTKFVGMPACILGKRSTP